MTHYVFTSATLNYLPKVRVLAESAKTRAPEARFVLLLGERRAAVPAPPIHAVDEIATLDDLGLPDVDRWAFGHSVVELCTAIKGRFLELLLARPDCESVVYFDPDVVVLGDLGTIHRRLAEGPVLLTPHLTAPERTLDTVADNEIAVLKHGLFNLGFLAVRADDEARRFASWWWARLQAFCRDDVANGLFTDQRWADLVPVFFPQTAIVRDPSWNVATWNLTNRRVEGSLAGGLRVDGEPLLFFHFSGLDSGAQLAMLRKYGRGMKGLFELREWYLRRCEELGAADAARAAWSLGSFDDGTPITAAHRGVYRDRPDLQRAYPNPFATAGDDSYARWFADAFPLAASADGDDAVRLAARYRAELDAIRRSRSWRLIATVRRLIEPFRR